MGQDDLIRLLATRNPHRRGTPAHDRHRRITSGMRVRDYVALSPVRRDALAELVVAQRMGVIGFERAAR
ncbi:hypothetical protein [Methylopila sp. 73B]|uniref:hypothetical protein n=1 Tax=Methylopila sp. 73B TaxID=1120792 RepID=UPI0003A01E9B|nr:hypothetical protein [Methylopila sp. 73B]